MDTTQFLPILTCYPLYTYNALYNLCRSLSVFGDVFSAIVTEKNFIPFRNAKLTLLLQDVLRCDSKLLLIAHVEAIPEDEGNDDTAVLIFAARCRGDHSLHHTDLTSHLTNPF